MINRKCFGKINMKAFLLPLMPLVKAVIYQKIPELTVLKLLITKRFAIIVLKPGARQD